MADSCFDSTALLTRCFLLAGAVLVLFVTPYSTTASLSPQHNFTNSQNISGSKYADEFVKQKFFAYCIYNLHLLIEACWNWTT